MYVCQENNLHNIKEISSCEVLFEMPMPHTKAIEK